MTVIPMVENARGAANFLRAGHARLRAGETEAAVWAFGRAAVLLPESAEPWVNLGLARRAMGDFVGAARALDRAAALAPGADEIAAELAVSLDILGRSGEAADQLAAMVRAGRGGTRAAAALARAAVRAGQAGEFATLVEAHLPGPAASVEDRRAYHFAAAELHDRLGAYARAFGHARAANALSERHYHPAREAARIDGLIAAARVLPALSLAGVKAQAGAAGGAPRPLFVVGMPRSGIGLMARILAAHPAIAAGPREPRALERLVLALPGADAPIQAGVPPKEPGDEPHAHAAALARAGRAYRAGLPTAGPGQAWVIDRTPLNLLHLPWAARMLPEARFLWLRRDARDTALSCFFQGFGDGRGFAFDLAHCGHFQGLVARLHGAWAADLGDRLLTVDYEDLVTGFAATGQRVLGHLGLKWDESVSRFDEGGLGATAAAASPPARRRGDPPLSSASIGRWRRYAPHLGALTAALADADPRLPAPRPAA